MNRAMTVNGESMSKEPGAVIDFPSPQKEDNMKEVTKVENETVAGLSPPEQKRAGIGQRIQDKLNRKKRDIFEIGRLLSEAKKTFHDDDDGHGQFMPWIEKTFGMELPYNTAWNYMTIYEKFKYKPQMIECYPVTILMCFIQQRFPEELIRKFEEDPEKYCKIVDMPKVKKNYEEYKKGKRSMYDIFAEKKENPDLAFELLRNEGLKKNLDVVMAQIQSGFSNIDRGIGLVRKYKRMIPPPGMRDHFNKEFDARIARLQKEKVAFNAAVDKYQKRLDAGQEDDLPEKEAANL